VTNSHKEILTPSVLRIMGIIGAKGEARVVGGAVRDMLMGRPIGDIDLATTLPPEQVMELLKAQNVKTVPTGLAHGTITAVIDHVGYEITTLRHDVETDGRHATVAFTDDWQTDAARRDFTFNALYMDAAGKIYDYFDGKADADAGRVRFIGDAQMRIREDVLRILRFFRFYAWYGNGEADSDALLACRTLANLIPDLSAERVAHEILKLLKTQNPLAAWHLMIEGNVTEYFLQNATDTKRLENLLENEKQHKEQQSSLTRLAALLPQDEDASRSIATKLRFANRDGDTLVVLAKLPGLIGKAEDTKALRRLLYIYGAENCRCAIFLEGKKIFENLSVLSAWENPLFPLKGQDIVKLNIPAGPQVGDILRKTEEWWIAGDFRADRTGCLAQAKTISLPAS